MNKTFELREVASGKFRVMSGKGDTVGSISVEPHEIDNLLRCWSGPSACLSKPKAYMSSHKNPMVAAMLAHKPKGLNPQGVLRGM